MADTLAERQKNHQKSSTDKNTVDDLQEKYCILDL